MNIPKSTAQNLSSEQRIAWALNQPNMSIWLKEALRTALDQDPVSVLNDLEILRDLLSVWADAKIRSMHGHYDSRSLRAGNDSDV